MRGRIKKLLMMLLTMTVIVTSMPATMLRVQATESNTEEQVASVSDGDSQEEEDIQSLTTEDGTEEGTEAVAEVTRAEWLSSLATTFEMTVEDDNYPDNYFSDLDSTSEYYYDILLNVEFGVIDVEEGGEVRPDDPATREFAAHTLNYCLGYQLDESTVAACSDIDDSEYREDLYIAVNRGWFETVDGLFLPEQYITLVEAEAMLADATAILASMEVDTAALSSYDLADDIIVITKECDEISMDENELVTIVVTDLQESIATGNRFAIYQNTIPTVYVAQTVSVEGSVTTITATIDDSADAYTTVDAEGIIAGSIADIEALDGAEIIFVDEETEEEYESAEAIIALYGANSTKLTNTTVYVKKKIDLGDGLKGQVELKLKNAKITYDVNAFDLSAYAYLECDTELSFKYEADLDAYSPITDVRLVNWTVPGVGGFVVSADLDLKAAASGVQKGYLKTGVEVSKSDGVRLITGFKAKSFTLVAQAQADLNLTAKLGITDLPALKAYAYATIGGKASVTRTEWTDGSVPTICVDFKAYIYAKYGVKGSVKFLGYEAGISIDKNIISEKNSPIRCVKHYDDGLEVTECGRDAVVDDGSSGDSSSGGTTSTGTKRYVTPANSSWSGSYWGSGTPSAGEDSDGNVIPMYSYSVNSDGETVTITGYNGSATSLVIPGTLDGYTVTAIGDSVFENNAKLYSVSIPDSVTSIGTYAFYNCTKLESVKLSETLKTIGDRVFQGCTGLETIEIPDSVEIMEYGVFYDCNNLTNVRMSKNLAQMGGNTFKNCMGLTEIDIPKSLTSASTSWDEIGEAGEFYGCNNLKQVNFEEGVTEIPENLFYGCGGISSIIIPDSVTSIEAYAFCNCTNLKSVQLSENLKTIGDRVFQGCTSLETIEIPDSVETMEYGVFYDCGNLKNVIMSKGLKQMGGNTFKNCIGLTEIEIPKSLTSASTSWDEIGEAGEFYGCNNLKKINFEEGTTEIPENLFYRCEGVSGITIPDSVTAIEANAFYNCKNLKSVQLSENLKTIGDGVFRGCTSLESIEIPDL